MNLQQWLRANHMERQPIEVKRTMPTGILDDDGESPVLIPVSRFAFAVECFSRGGDTARATLRWQCPPRTSYSSAFYITPDPSRNACYSRWDPEPTEVEAALLRDDWEPFREEVLRRQRQLDEPPVSESALMQDFDSFRSRAQIPFREFIRRFYFPRPPRRGIPEVSD